MVDFETAVVLILVETWSHRNSKTTRKLRLHCFWCFAKWFCFSHSCPDISSAANSEVSMKHAAVLPQQLCSLFPMTAFMVWLGRKLFTPKEAMLLNGQSGSELHVLLNTTVASKHSPSHFVFCTCQGKIWGKHLAILSGTEEPQIWPGAKQHFCCSHFDRGCARKSSEPFVTWSKLKRLINPLLKLALLHASRHTHRHRSVKRKAKWANWNPFSKRVLKYNRSKRGLERDVWAGLSGMELSGYP